MQFPFHNRLTATLALLGAMLHGSALATVTIEFYFGELSAPDGTVGILVADRNGDGFTDIGTAAAGTILQTGETLGTGDDVIIAVTQAEDGAHWNGATGFGDAFGAIDYATFGIAEGTPLAFYWLPDHLSPGDPLIAGDRWHRFREDGAGGSAGTSGFIAPEDWGTWRISQLSPGLGGDFDSGNPANSGDYDEGFIPVQPPPAPANPGVIVTLTDTTISLSWNAAARAREYRIYRGTTNSFGSATEIGTSTATRFTDTTATVIGANYFYWVVAENPGGSSAPSGSTSGLRTFPAPANVDASDGQFDDKVRITWDAVPGAVSYAVLRNTRNQFGTSTEVANVSGTTFDDASGVLGVEYFYWITAFDGTHTSPPSRSDRGEMSPPPTPYRPDQWIGKFKDRQIGNNRYSADGLNQRVRQVSKNARRVIYHFTVQADGTDYDYIGMRGTRGNRTFRATYFEIHQGSENITAAVESGEYEDDFDPGDIFRFKLTVKPKGAARERRMRRSFVIRAWSWEDTRMRDVTRAEIVTKRRR